MQGEDVVFYHNRLEYLVSSLDTLLYTIHLIS